jgi:hypothetical protein
MQKGRTQSQSELKQAAITALSSMVTPPQPAFSPTVPREMRQWRAAQPRQALGATYTSGKDRRRGRQGGQEDGVSACHGHNGGRTVGG